MQANYRITVALFDEMNVSVSNNKHGRYIRYLLGLDSRTIDELALTSWVLNTSIIIAIASPGTKT